MSMRGWWVPVLTRVVVRQSMVVGVVMVTNMWISTVVVKVPSWWRRYDCVCDGPNALGASADVAPTLL